MFKNYLKIAFRNILKNKIYSFINIAGLAIGLAGFILISILIKNELSYENFHKKADRIYRVVEIQNQKGIGKLNVAVTMGPLSRALKNYFPEIENSIRLMPVPSVFCKIGTEGFYEDGLSFADPQVFNIFTIPFIEGDPKTALSNPNSLVISQSIAKKYFDNNNPVGKVITISYVLGKADFTVTGVIKDYPENSHIFFNMLGSLKFLENSFPWLKSWGTNSLGTYVLLNKGISSKEVEKKFPAFLKSSVPNEQQSDLKMYLQSLKDIHLYSGNITYQTYQKNESSISTVYIFSVIAFFILLIACINFMNLATARSSKRIKEIGMRKVLGSSRKKLIYQFIGEAVFISFIAFLLSILIVEIALPMFKSIFEDRIINIYTDSTTFLLELIGITLLVGILSGSYPAIFLSRFQPAQSIRGSIPLKAKGSYLRKILVVFQFSIAVALMICTGVVYNQISFIMHKNLGFNKGHVVYLPIRSEDTRAKINLLKTELSKNSNIAGVAAGSGLSGASGSEGDVTVAGTNGQKRLMMRYSYVDPDYINTMQMKIVQGRNFSPLYPTDSVSSVIINETAVKKFGWKNPIGKQFEYEGGTTKKVIGVVKDFNFFSLHSPIGPLIMSIQPDRFFYLLIRIKPGNIPAILDFIKSTWESIVPGRPFDYSFLEKHFDEIYKNEQQTEQLYGFFSFLAIFIACLGLFGLASYTVEQRTKEIGVRKVLGASVSGVVLLLSKDFLKLVLVATIIAIPVSYYIMANWLQDFAYRTKISPAIFILVGLTVLAIALATISFQAIKAATSNPIKSLRYE
jgi:putative ABC transport system permease protein